MEGVRGRRGKIFRSIPPLLDKETAEKIDGAVGTSGGTVTSASGANFGV